jgi:hypothetical protein
MTGAAAEAAHGSFSFADAPLGIKPVTTIGHPAIDRWHGPHRGRDPHPGVWDPNFQKRGVPAGQKIWP